MYQKLVLGLARHFAKAEARKQLEVLESLSGIFQNLELEAYLLPRAGHIHQKPPTKNSEFFEHYFTVAMQFCFYKGNFEKYKGKYDIRQFLL
jgi:hypothetical protein